MQQTKQRFVNNNIDRKIHSISKQNFYVVSILLFKMLKPPFFYWFIHFNN